MKDFFVSILVPVYGVERYIERCAISLFEQTYKNLEYVFVDDCSPDNSIQILEDVISRYPFRQERTKIIRHQKNRGLAAARNTAVDAANGEFVVHVDSDDFVDIHLIEKMVNKQQENDADLVRANAKVFYPHFTTIFKFPNCNVKDFCKGLIARKYSVVVWGMLIRKSLYLNHKIVCREGVNIGEDYQVTPRLAYYASSVSFVNESLYFYDCQNENSYTFSYNQFKDSQIQQSYGIIEEFLYDKPIEYLNAYNYAKATRHIRALKEFALIGKGNKTVFEEHKKAVFHVPFKYQKNIPLRHRILIYMPTFFSACCYMKFITWVGNITRKR